MIPEFPIKKEDNYQSNRVDYLALSGDLEQALLIELKTDMESIDPEQIKLLKGAACKGIREIIVDLKAITISDSVKDSTQTRGKYFHLFRALEETSLIKFHDGDELEKLLPSGKLKTDLYKKYVENIELEKCPRLKVLYVLPENPGGEGYEQKKFKEINELMNDEKVVKKIHFGCFSEYVKDRGAIGSRFAKSLDCWKKRAGLCLPQ